MDGTFKGEKFFRCPAGYGVMVTEARIAEVVASDADIAAYFKGWEETLAAEQAEESKAAESIRVEKAKIQKMKEAFTSIDKDGSRSIEKKEYVEYMVKNQSDLGDEAY